MKGIFRKDVLKKGLLGLVVALVAIQLVPVDRTSPPVTADIAAPANVRAVLKRACYDCHSNETTWPWYSRVAPVSWLVARDVREGRKELNFSDWGGYAAKRQARKLKECGSRSPRARCRRGSTSSLTATPACRPKTRPFSGSGLWPARPSAP